MTLPPLTAAPFEVRFRPEEVALKVLFSPVRPEGQLIRLGKANVTIGRDLEATVWLDDLRLSRRHAEVRREDGRYVLVDLGSMNGSWVNGQRTARQGLLHGDSVRLGSSVFLFVDRRETATERVRAEIHSAACCVDDNFRHLARAISDGSLTVEEAGEVLRDCARAVNRLERHANAQLEQPGEATPVVTRAVSRSSHV